MTRLVSLYGRSKMGAAPQYQFSLFSMSGAPTDPAQIDPEMLKDPILTADPRELSNVDAGIQALYAIAYMNPGITFGDLLRMSQNSLKGNIFGDLGNWTKKTLSDGIDKLGDIGGSTVRLLTDQEVQSGLQNYAAAYATGGQSAALQGLLGGEGDQSAIGQVMGFLSNLGKSSKSQVQQASMGTGLGSIDPKLLFLGMGGLIFVVLLLKK